jgi:hypothetical protein
MGCGELLHCAVREHLLSSGARVATDFLQRAMAGHRHDLVLRSAVVRETRRCGLSKPVSRAMWEPYSIAPFPHLVAKPSRSERSIELGYEEGEVANRTCIDESVKSKTASVKSKTALSA